MNKFTQTYPAYIGQSQNNFVRKPYFYKNCRFKKFYKLPELQPQTIAIF